MKLFTFTNSLHVAAPARGFATLLALLLLAAVGVAVSVSLFMESVNLTQTASTFQESEQAKGIANACAEVAIQQLVTLPTYVGTGSLTLGQGSCTYVVLLQSVGVDWIESTAVVGQTTRKVKIQITTPGLKVQYWQEVGDF